MPKIQNMGASTPGLVAHPTRDALAADAVTRILDIIEHVLSERTIAHISLTGGTMGIATLKAWAENERVKDIEVIASHILVEMSAQHNLPQKRLSPEAVSLLLSCSWPGNIKQLQGVIEQAFFHTPGSIIEAENIKLPGDKTLERSWKYDKEAFIAAWKSAGGNISKLATMLDVSRVTLYRYLKKYGLGPKAK